MTDLGPGYATAINASALVLGTANGQTVLWENGMKAVLETGIAEAVNDADWKASMMFACKQLATSLPRLLRRNYRFLEPALLKRLATEQTLNRLRQRRWEAHRVRSLEPGCRNWQSGAGSRQGDRETRRQGEPTRK